MRPRKDKDAQKLPPRVYKHGKKFRWHPKSGGSIALCSSDSSMSVVWREYEKRLINKQNTVAELFSLYFSSKEFKKLSASSQSGNLSKSKMLLKVFGQASPDIITPKHVRAYMDKRGLVSESSANAEFSVLSKIMAWAYERGKVRMNPCRGVKRFTPGQRDRYISHDEYKAVYECATDICKVAMELSYLCAARLGDIVQLERKDLLAEGIYIKQGKTGKKQIKQWSPRLRKAIELSETLCETLSPFVICNKHGNSVQIRLIQRHYTDAKIVAAEKYGIKTDFTFHDLKAKGISDYEGTMADKQRFSGHKMMAQINTYDRRPDLVPSLGSDKKQR